MSNSGNSERLQDLKNLVSAASDAQDLTLSKAESICSRRIVDKGYGTVWLHVKVRSVWQVVDQVSTAKAWTTSDESGNSPVKVDEITISELKPFWSSLQLECHGTEEKSRKNVSEVETEEHFFGTPAVRPKKAIATGKCYGPSVGSIKGEADPFN